MAFQQSPTLEPNSDSKSYLASGVDLVVVGTSQQPSISMVDGAKKASTDFQLIVFIMDLVVVIGVMAAVLMMVPPDTLRKLDMLFSAKHSLEEGQVLINHATSLGGVLTLGFAPLCIGVVLLLVSPWINQANLLIQQSLTTRTHSDVVTSTIGITSEAVGLLKDACDKVGPQSYTLPKNTLITTSGAGAWTIKATFEQATSTCSIRLQSPPNAISVFGEGTILIRLGGYPVKLRTTISASSALPDQASTVSLTMVPPPGRMMTQNASITLDFIPEVYTCSTNSSTGSGYQINVPRRLITSTVKSAPAEVAEDQLVLKLNLRSFNTVQRTSVTQLQTVIALVSQIASTVMALLGGMAFLFSLAEQNLANGSSNGKPDEEGAVSVEMADAGLKYLSPEMGSEVRQIIRDPEMVAEFRQMIQEMTNLPAKSHGLTPPTMGQVEPKLEAKDDKAGDTVDLFLQMAQVDPKLEAKDDKAGDIDTAFPGRPITILQM